MKTTPELTSPQIKELQVLVAFISLYCKVHHQYQRTTLLLAEIDHSFRHGVQLCADCQGLLEHALEKRLKCPLKPKPSCKRCHIHCYSKEYRARIREIMAYSGRKMILRGRLDYLWHYYF